MALGPLRLQPLTFAYGTTHPNLVHLRRVIDHPRVAHYTIVAGNAARPVRARLPAGTVEALLDLRWWDWPVERIRRAIPALVEGDISRLRILAP